MDRPPYRRRDLSAMIEVRLRVYAWAVGTQAYLIMTAGTTAASQDPDVSWNQLPFLA